MPSLSRLLLRPPIPANHSMVTTSCEPPVLRGIPLLKEKLHARLRRPGPASPVVLVKPPPLSEVSEACDLTSHLCPQISIAQGQHGEQGQTRRTCHGSTPRPTRRKSQLQYANIRKEQNHRICAFIRMLHGTELLSYTCNVMRQSSAVYKTLPSTFAQALP